VISGLSRGVVEDIALLACYNAYVVSCLPTSQDISYIPLLSRYEFHSDHPSLFNHSKYFACEINEAPHYVISILNPKDLLQNISKPLNL
jgi:hypothetical protein